MERTLVTNLTAFIRKLDAQLGLVYGIITHGLLQIITQMLSWRLGRCGTVSLCTTQYAVRKATRWSHALLVTLCFLLLIPQPAQAQEQTGGITLIEQRPDEQRSDPIIPDALSIDDLNEDDEIVYLDSQGTIRVLDTNQANPDLIDWFSNEGGFVDFAVGDFNGDGDMEIAGIKGSGDSGTLVVYDPVLSPGTSVPTGRSINGIPWQLFYTRAIGFTPLIVAAGNLDETTPEDEILLGYDLGDGQSEIVILRLEESDGEENSVVTEVALGEDNQSRFGFDRLWSSVTIGQMDGIGPDEIVLIDSTYIPDKLESLIAFFQLDGLTTNQPFFKRSNSFASWKRSAIGNIDNDTAIEIVAIRKIICCDTLPDTSHIIPTAWFFEFSTVTGKIVDADDGCPDEPHLPTSCPDDVDSLYFDPAPADVFLGDVNDTGESEAMFLRSYPLRVANKLTPDPNDFTDPLIDTTKPPTWFWLVNRGSDIITAEDVANDQYTTHIKRTVGIGSSLNINDLRINNEWSVGDSGDFEGDGLEEVAIMQPGAVRTYIYRNNAWTLRREDFVDALGLRIKSANLDRNGYVEGIELFTSISSNLTQGVIVGTAVPATITVRTALNESVVANLSIPQIPDWLTVTGPASFQTSSDIPILIDATDLLPGQYQFDISVTSSASSVANSPLIKSFNFTVLPAEIDIEPQSVTVIEYPCITSQGGENSVANKLIAINGTAGITYTAAIVLDDGTTGDPSQGGTTTIPNGQVIQWPSAAPWISATSPGNLIPGTIELTVDLNNWPDPTDPPTEYTIFVQTDSRAADNTARSFSIPIRVLCAQSRIFLPLLSSSQGINLQYVR